ncbi:MAG: hypothetical protein FWF24_05125 [Alphaproteobacteria bacterium]|nr:hypothetical protein [Alphaproteobacteria bacterium]
MKPIQGLLSTKKAVREVRHVLEQKTAVPFRAFDEKKRKCWAQAHAMRLD